MSLTRDDLSQIKAVVQDVIDTSVTTAITASEARQGVKLDHAVKVLEQKISRTEQNLRTYIDARIEDVLEIVNTSFGRLSSDPIIQTLDRRVTHLEQTVFPKK